MQNLNSASNKATHSQRLSQSVAINKDSGQNIIDEVNTETNVVHVDFIGAEYVGNGLGGFAKKHAKGYNGGKATGKKKGDGDGGDGGDGEGGSDGGDGGDRDVGGDGGDGSKLRWSLW